MSQIIEEVETFIRRCYDLELLISPEAHELTTKSQQAFSDALADAISDYEINRGDTYKMQLCLGLINKAYSHGLIAPGQQLIGKLDECRKKNAELEKDLAICLTNYSTLQREHDKLLRMLDQNQSEDSQKEGKP
jgi:hypothetical protein